MTATTTARKVFRVLGTTDDCTRCELCGLEDLRSTIALEILDEEGNGSGEVVYYGSSCGPKAVGWTVREFNKRVRTAEREAKEAARIAREQASEARHAAWQEAFITWCAAERGLTVPNPSASLIARFNTLRDMIEKSGSRLFLVTTDFYASAAHARLLADQEAADAARA